MPDFYASQTEIANRHDFTDTFTKEYTANQTNLTLITPTSGYKIQITHVTLNTKSTTGQAKIYDSKSNREIAILNAEGGGLFNTEMRFVAATNSPIKLTSTTGTNSLFVQINYKEVKEATGLTTSTTTSTSTSTTTT